MANRTSRSSPRLHEAAAESSPAAVPPQGERGLRPYSGAAIAAIFLAMTVLSSGDLIEIVPAFAPFVAGPLFPFVHETHDILAVMLALYAAHKLTPAVGRWVIVWFLALHLLFAYFTFPAELPELVRIALTAAAAFLGVHIISLRRRAEERVRLQATALDAAANAILITDRQGDIAWVNPAFTMLTGYTPQEAAGKNPRELLKSGKHGPAFYKELWDTILSGRVWRGELVNRRKDGSLYSEEQTITPVSDGQGAITHFVAIKQDISARKQAEEALHDSERRFRALIEHSSDGIVLLNAEGTILYDRPAVTRILGYAPDERVGRNVFEFIHPDERQTSMERFASFARQPGAVVNSQGRFRHKDDSWRWVEATRTNLLAEPSVEAIIVNYRDVSERKQAEEEIHRLAKFPSENPNPVLRLNQDGVILYANYASQALLRDWGCEVGSYAPVFWRDLVKETLGSRSTKIVDIHLAERIFSIDVAPIAEARYANLYGKDITELRRNERIISVQYATTRVLAQSTELNEAIPQILQAICEGLGWDRGELWEVDRGAGILRIAKAWHTPSLELPEFEASTQETTFLPGVGLPGRVWRDGEPVWIPDATQDSNFLRTESAQREGMHTAFAFPIPLEGEIEGVMAFLSRKIHERDDDLLEIMTHLGSQIGQFMKRMRAEEALQESEVRYRALFDQAAMPIVVVDPETGRFVDFNAAAFVNYGYTREEFAALSLPDIDSTETTEDVKRKIDGLM